jgi:hypothetical protein
MKNQTYRMTMLYDFYGDLLTERQKEFFDLYYNEDLSLAEIAENYGITRQGVRDIIVRAEGSLQEIEAKTGLINRYHIMQESMEALQQTVRDLKQLNDNILQNNELEGLCERLEAAVSALRKD